MPERPDDQRLDELLRGEIADRLGDPVEIEDEELAAYVAGELNAEQETDLQRRLETSPDAVQRLLDFEELMAPVETDGAADFETAAAWRALAPQLAQAGNAGTVQDPTGTSPQGPAPRTWLPAIAALLALCVLGLGWQNLRLSRVAEDLRARQGMVTPDVPLIYFDANRSDDGGERLVADDSGWVVLMLGPYPWLEAGRVQVEVSRGAIVVWSGSLELPELGAARLGLPGLLLPEGEYQIRVTAGEQVVAEHSLVAEGLPSSEPANVP